MLERVLIIIIIRFQPDLVICRLQINATEHFGTLQVIEHFVYSWQGILVLVEGPVVNAHAQPTSTLLDE